MHITSLQNPKIKEARHLWKRRDREEQGRFLIEGFRELSRALRGGVRMETLFVCSSLFLGTQEGDLIAAWQKEGVAVYTCSEPVFRSLSYRDRPDGLLGIAWQEKKGLEALPQTPAPFYVVAEGIEKPGNLGTILRSADAAGATGVIVCDRVTDIYNPNVVRASVGTLFTVPVVEAESGEALAWLQARGIAVVAATPHATQVYTETPLTGAVAVIVGAEQYGLSPVWMQQADYQVRIPMQGVADSLNVAMAATLLLFEVRRQRGVLGSG